MPAMDFLQYSGISTCNIMEFYFATFCIFILQQIADIKTHLRELSIAVGLGIYTGKVNSNCINIMQITPQLFYKYANTSIDNDISIAKNILIDSFTNEHYQIIKNGFELSNRILKVFNNINSKSHILWLGYDTQKENPVDLQVDNLGFSLKEESYILENMGLYKYLNLMTNSNFKRGLHVFDYFAYNEYNAWFQYTWNKLVSSENNWFNDNGRYTSLIEIHNNKIILNYNNEDIKVIPKQNINIRDFQNYTDAVVREKVFSKWISDKLRKDQGYIDIKNKCSVKAGQAVCEYIKNNLNPLHIARLLQIYRSEYYYAKSTNNEIRIFKVPSLSNFANEIKIKNFEYSVPSSQLNIKTTIINTISKKELIFRNECRFSHGQFNGTPEAKMYYEKGNDLSAIYTPIYEETR